MAVHTLVKIVIPLYRLPLSQAEETAIKHTARILQSYPICFIIAESPPRKTHTASRNHVGKQSLAGTRKRNFRLQRHDDVKRLLQSFCRHGIYSGLPTRRMDIQRRTGKVVPEKLRLYRRSMDTSRKIRQVPAPIVAKAAKNFPAYRHKQARPFRQSGERRAIFTANKFIYRGLRKIRKRNYPIQKTLPPSLQRRRILGDNSSQFQIPDCPRSVGICL